jgi:HAE1 family hydrophobic/amphiphilic exporter-1
LANGKVSNEFGELMKRPEIQYAITNLIQLPQYQMDINVERARMRVWKSKRFNTMQGYYGGLYTTDFNKFGKHTRNDSGKT